MQKVEIQGEYRKNTGKGVARKLRGEGKIPGVLYSKGGSTPLVLYPKEIQAILRSAAGENALITLNAKGEGVGKHVTILRDYQKDPLNGKILHADLFEISMTEPIEVKVMVEIIGDIPIGVKRDGGVFRHHVRELEIRCLPTNIPDHIQIDASNLAMGEMIHISDLSLGEGIELMGNPTQAIVSVTTTMSDEKLEALLTSTPAEAAPVVPATEQKADAEKSV